MQAIALEEHVAFPDLIARIDPARRAARGYPESGATPAFMRVADRLAEIGPVRLADMDGAGIALQILSASGPGASLLPPAEAVVFARAFNDRLAEAIARHPTRFAGFAHLPLTAPEQAAAELERAVQRLGFKGAMINGTVEGRFLDDPAFTPVLAAAEALGVPLYLHPDLPPPEVGAAYFRGLPEEAGFLLSGPGYGWHAETALHVLRLVLAGTLDRHPRLRLIVGHLGEGLPFYLQRIDEVFADFAARRLARKPSAALADQLYVTTSGFFSLPPFLAALLAFGVDRLLFSVDYPFAANAAGRAFLDALPLPPAEREKIAHLNARRLFRLDPPAAASPPA
jgi:predicted TIM-barrel fold metal-dependent hydrolase